MPGKFRSTYKQEQFADTKQLDGFRDTLRLLPAVFKEVAEKVSPEFGAYMAYSLWLETGTKKMAARPHIVPAVEATAGTILDLVGGALLDFMTNSWQSPRGITVEMAERAYSAAWIGALNGPTRAYAVTLGTTLKVRQYGFHLRSIFGYVYKRTHEEIVAQQAEAEAQRKLQRTAKSLSKRYARVKKRMKKQTRDRINREAKRRKRLGL